MHFRLLQQQIVRNPDELFIKEKTRDSVLLWLVWILTVERLMLANVARASCCIIGHLLNSIVGFAAPPTVAANKHIQTDSFEIST